MDVPSSPLLELHLVAPVLDTQGVTLGCEDFAEHHLHPLVEISRGSDDIPPDKLTEGLLNFLFNELPQRLPLAIGGSGFCNYLRLPINYIDLHVDAVASLQQQGSKVGIPPEVCTAEGEEDVESPQILCLGNHLIPLSGPILDAVWNPFQASEGIRQCVGDLAICRDTLLSSEANQRNVAQDSLFLKIANSCIEVGWTSAKSALEVADALLEIALLCQLHSPLLILAIVACEVVEVGEGFDVPVLVFEETNRLLSFT